MSVSRPEPLMLYSSYVGSSELAPFGTFELRILDLFRISIFVFRI
jgi:hypothetical protein